MFEIFRKMFRWYYTFHFGFMFLLLAGAALVFGSAFIALLVAGNTDGALSALISFAVLGSLVGFFFWVARDVGKTNRRRDEARRRRAAETGQPSPDPPSDAMRRDSTP